MDKNKIGIVILAAGDGKRMQSTTPKVLHLLQGKPLIDHVLNVAENSDVAEKIVVVVPAKHHLIQDYLGERVLYAIQSEQKGTGHAVSCCESLLKGEVDHVIVLNSDIPCVKPESLRKLVEEHVNNKNTVTILTTKTEDFTAWRAPFLKFGRILRDTQQKIQEIREYKDCDDEQKEIKEVNSGQYCFDANWLFDHLKLLRNENAQGEYYLTDLIALALQEGKKVSATDIDPKESVGVSTQDDLKIIHEFLEK